MLDLCVYRYTMQKTTSQNKWYAYMFVCFIVVVAVQAILNAWQKSSPSEFAVVAELCNFFFRQLSNIWRIFIYLFTNFYFVAINK